MSGLSALAGRRFPPPRPVEEQSACFVVRDHSNPQPECYGH
jgi:hypothetical protein